MTFENLVVCVGIVLLFFVLTGQTKQFIIFLIIVVLGLFLQKNYESPRELFNSAKETFTNTSQRYKNQTSILSNIGKKLPEVYELQKIKNKLHQYLIPYRSNDNSNEYANVLDLQIEYYFTNIYINLEDIMISDLYPQQNYITMMSNKHHLYRILDNFIYILPPSDRYYNEHFHDKNEFDDKFKKYILNNVNNTRPRISNEYKFFTSNLPDDFITIRKELEKVFNVILIKISEYVNKYDNEKIHSSSGFVPYFNEPSPKNLFYDNHSMY